MDCLGTRVKLKIGDKYIAAPFKGSPEDSGMGREKSQWVERHAGYQFIYLMWKEQCPERRQYTDFWAAADGLTLWWRPGRQDSLR